MTRSFLPILAAALLALTAASAQSRITDETVVARVGSAAITRRDLLAHANRYYGKLALDQLIDQSVLRQEGERLSVQVTDAELSTRAAAVKKENGLNFAIALEKEGITEDAWLRRLRNLMLGEKVRDRKWPVTDADLVRLSVRYARLQTERQAKDLIREAANKVNFELLALQNSLDKENGGLVQPNPFLRVENPYFFRLATDARLRVGQVTPEPIPSQEFWLVLKLENRLPADTLKDKRREDAVARVKAFRTAALLSTARKLYKIEYPGGEAEQAKVTPLRGTGKGESIARKEVTAYLLDYVGRTALEQLVERSIMDQEAARLRLTVSEAQLNTRAAALQKNLGQKAFQAALQAEGVGEDAWRERLRYEMLAEAVITAKNPAKPEEMERYVARFIKVESMRDAEQIIQAAQSGADFAQLRTRFRDQKGDGFVSPRQFLRTDGPTLFDHIKKSNTAPGQVVPTPLQVGKSFLVFKVEQRLGPETLTPQERADVSRKVNFPRMGLLLEENRKGYKVDYPITMTALIADARA